MAETLRAELQLDLSQFTSQLSVATQAAQQFAATTSRALQSVVAALLPVTQAQQATTQATTQTTQAYTQFVVQLQNATQAMRQQATTGQAAVTIQQQLATALQATAQAVQTLGQAQHQNTQGTNTWAGALQVAGGLGLATSIQAVVSAVKSWVVESAQVAVKMQSLEAAFRAITGSTAAAQRELTFLRDTAQRTGTDFVSLATAFKSLEAASRGTALEGQSVRNVFTAIAEASRVMGLSASETHRTLVALEQMMSKGKVSAEELRRQLGNALPGAFGIASRAMGVTTEQLDQMLRSGQLLAEDFLPRFAAQIRRELGPGLEASTKTAAASFARLGNEVTAMATEVGNAVLKIVQPIADFITRTLASFREANERARGEAGKAAADAVAGKPTFSGGTQAFQVPGGATEDQLKRIGDLNLQLIDDTFRLHKMEEQLAQSRSNNATFLQRTTLPLLEKNLEKLREQHAAHEQEFRDLVKLAEAQTRVDQNIAMQDNEELSKGVLGKNIVEATARQKKQVEELLTLHKQLPLELQKAELIAEKFPTIYDKTEEKLNLVKKSIETIAEKLRAKPDLAALPEVQKLVKEEEARAASLQAQIDKTKELAQDEAARARAEEQTLERRKKLLNDVMQGADFKLRSSDLEEITADLAYFNKLLTTETGPRLVAVRTILQELDDAKKKALGTFPTSLVEGLEALGEAWGALEHDIKTGTKAAEDYTDAQDKLNVMLGKGTSEFEAQRIKLRQYVAGLEKLTGVTEKSQEALRVGLQVIDDKELEKGTRAMEKAAHDAERAAREAARPWKELAHEVQSTLASAFEGLMNGTLDIFDAIKKAFIHMLAEMAAAALTPIIINAAMGAMSGMGGGVGGGGGAGGGGGGAGGGAMGMVSSAAGVVGMGRMLGGNAVINQLLAQKLFTVGGGAAGGIGGGTAAGAAAGTSVSVGTVLGGIGMGVGAGLLISKLNSLMGLHGTANTMLSSTAGGAIGGTFILPGVGTAIGAAVGAIAGAIISLLNKTAKPTMDIQQVRQGVVGMEAGRGLSLQQGFQINRTTFGDIRVLDIKAFVERLNESVDSLFTQVIEGFRGASPEVQAALVEPLNEIARQIGIDIEHTRFTGKDWAKQLQTFFEETLPNDFNNLVGPLADAVRKVDPLIRAWGDIITALRADIERLDDLQAEFDTAIDEQIAQLKGAFAPPHDQFQAGQGRLADLQGRLAEAEPADRLGLAGQITDLIQQLFTAARGNFQFDAHAADAVLHAFDTLAQQLQGVQDHLAEMLQQFYSGDVQQQTTLAPQIQEAATALLELARAQAAETRGSFRGDPHASDAILQALNTTTEQFKVTQDRLAEMLQQFYSGDAKTQATLAPQLQQTATALFQLARTQAEETRGSFRGDAHASDTIFQALNTTAQQFKVTQDHLAELLQKFYSGDAKTQATLAPQLQQTATALFQLAKTQAEEARGSFRGDAHASDTIFQALNTTAQQFKVTQDRLAGLLQQFYSGDAKTQATLAPQLQQTATALFQLARAQAEETRGSFRGDPHASDAILQALNTTTEQFKVTQDRLAEMLQQFYSGDAKTQATLAPQLQQTATALFQLAKTQAEETRGSFRGDPHASDSILHALNTTTEQFKVTQDRLAGLLQQFYSGDAKTQATLAPQLQQTATALFQLARAQAEETRGSFRGDPHASDAILQALNTTTEQFKVTQDRLAELLQQFYSGDAKTQATLAPQLQQTATALFQLARNQAAEVRGSFRGDAHASDEVRRALDTTAEQFHAAQGQLAGLLQQFYSGDAKTQATLAPQIQQVATAVFQLARTETAAAREAADQAAAVQQTAQATLAQAVQTQTAAQETLAAQQALMHNAVIAQNTGMDTHQTTVRGLQQGLYSPAEQFMANQARLQDLMGRFRGGDAATQALLGPEIERLASETLGLARGQEVLGQDVLLVRRVQEQLIAQVQEVAKVLNQAELDALSATVDAAKKQLDISVEAVATAQAHLAVATQALTDANNHATQMETWLQSLQQALVQIIDQSQGTAEASVERVEAALKDLQAYLGQLVDESQGTAEASIQRVEAALKDLQAYLGQLVDESQGTAEASVERVEAALVDLQKYLGQLVDESQGTAEASVQRVEAALKDLQAYLGQLVDQSQGTAEASVERLEAALKELQAYLGQLIDQSQGTAEANVERVEAALKTLQQYLAQLIDQSQGIAEASVERVEAALKDLQAYLGGVITQTQSTTQQSLDAYQQALIDQLEYTRAITDTGFDTMRNALEKQIVLATTQINFLAASLGHLESVDGVVAASRALLGQINTALGNPLQISTTPGSGDATQTSLMTTSTTYLGQMRDTLKGIAILLGAKGTWSFQHGSFYVPFNMQATLHQGERVLTSQQAAAGGGNTIVTINVQGGHGDESVLAERVVREIEKRGRLQNTRIVTSRR